MRIPADPNHPRLLVVLLLAALLGLGGLVGAPVTAAPWPGATIGSDRAEAQPTPAEGVGTTSPAVRRGPRFLPLVAAVAAVLRTVGARRRRRDLRAPATAGRWAPAATRGPPPLPA